MFERRLLVLVDPIHPTTARQAAPGDTPKIPFFAFFRGPMLPPSTKVASWSRVKERMVKQLWLFLSDPQRPSVVEPPGLLCPRTVHRRRVPSSKKSSIVFFRQKPQGDLPRSAPPIVEDDLDHRRSKSSGPILSVFETGKPEATTVLSPYCPDGAGISYRESTSRPTDLALDAIVLRYLDIEGASIYQSGPSSRTWEERHDRRPQGPCPVAGGWGP